jgi:HEAT repeat protein
MDRVKSASVAKRLVGIFAVATINAFAQIPPVNPDSLPSTSGSAPTPADSRSNQESESRSVSKPGPIKPGFSPDNVRLNHTDPNVRSTYARSIARTGSVESIPTLEHLLINDSSEMVRINAANALGHIARPEVEPSLEKAIYSPSPVPVRAAAIRGLSNIRSKSSLQTLIRTAEEPNPRIRQVALESLGRRADPESIPVVMKYVRDRDVAVAAWACWALGEFRNKEGVPILMDVFKSSNALEVRQASALALARIRDPQVAPTLAASALSRDETFQVRLASLKGLSRMYPADKGTVDLTPLVRDDNPQVRAASALPIATSERGDIAAAMKALLVDPQPAVRQSAVIAMGLRPSRFSSQLADVATDRTANTSLRILALTALSELPPSELARETIFSKLTQLLNTAEPADLQISGVKMLARVGNESAKAAIRRFGNEANLDARVKAAVEGASK